MRDVLKYTGAQAISEEEALAKGMAEKSKSIAHNGIELCAKA